MYTSHIVKIQADVYKLKLDKFTILLHISQKLLLSVIIEDDCTLV